MTAAAQLRHLWRIGGRKQDDLDTCHWLRLHPACKSLKSRAVDEQERELDPAVAVSDPAKGFEAGASRSGYSHHTSLGPLGGRREFGEVEPWREGLDPDGCAPQLTAALGRIAILLNRQGNQLWFPTTPAHAGGVWHRFWTAPPVEEIAPVLDAVNGQCHDACGVVLWATSQHHMPARVVGSVGLVKIHGKRGFDGDTSVDQREGFPVAVSAPILYPAAPEKGGRRLRKDPLSIRFQLRVIVAGPGKYRLVVRMLDKLLLEPEEGVAPFAVQQRHVDSKDAQQAVCFVFDHGGLPGSSPVHLFGDAGFGQIFPASVAEKLGVDSRSNADALGQTGPIAYLVPCVGEEDDALWS